MDTFFRSNPGMSSRIAHHIAFPDYTVDELERIAHRMAAQLGYAFAPDAVPALREYLRRRMARPRFANARSVRNAIERARLRQARRLVDGPDPRVDRNAVTTIEAADLLGSRVFDPDPAAEEGGGTTATPAGSGTMPG